VPILAAALILIAVVLFRLRPVPDPAPVADVRGHITRLDAAGFQPLPNGAAREYYLGPHTPRLRNQDLDLLHRLWLEVTSDPRFAGTHHYHIVAVALNELQRELHSPTRAEVLDRLWQELQKRPDENVN
jgi:hypothetical protein